MRPDPFSLKIPKPDGDSRRAFQRDVEARARVLQHGFLSVPRIIDSDLTGDTPFLTEEVVFGRLPRLPADSDAVVELIQNPLWATYGKEGFRFKSVPQSMNVEDHASLLAKACAACRWDERWLPQNEFLRKADELLSGRGLMTFSFSHGDFGVHNILLTGHLDAHVIDWEHARRMITVRDLYRSIKEVPGVYEAVRERMAGLAASVPEKPILSMAEQFFMLALQPLLSWARRGRPNVFPAEQEKATAAVLQLSNWILLHERQLQQGTATAPFTTGLRRLCK